MKFPFSLGRLIARTHAMVALSMLLVVVLVMAGQVSRRTTFASTELHDDVMDRWGTPIDQAAPSVRFVQSGAVFQTLDRLPLDRQQVVIEAAMNYRKRGLVYFSGFDFAFTGNYGFSNDQAHPIDVAFAFPIDVARDRVLLSDVAFEVDGEPRPIALEDDDMLLWTGRLAPGQEVSVRIAYRGRGLDQFRYLLDPDMPVRGLDLSLHITGGGDGYDYPPGVVPATGLAHDTGGTTLRWRYDALEAGVPMGVILPSEKGFDVMIATLIGRAVIPFGLFFAGLVVLGIQADRRLRIEQTTLLCAGWLFFYVLLPYFAAFVHFYVAYVAALFIVGGLVVGYGSRVLGSPGDGPARRAVVRHPGDAHVRGLARRLHRARLHPGDPGRARVRDVGHHAARVLPGHRRAHRSGASRCSAHHDHDGR